MKENNHGYTLVELIVAIALLSVIALGAGTLLTSAARFYKNQILSQKVQYEAQLVMTQLQEQVIDCNDGIAWNDTSKTLMIVHKNAADEESVVMIHTDASTHKMYMAQATAVEALTEPTWSEDYLLADYISVFEIYIRLEGSSQNADIISLTLGLERDGKTYNGTEDYTLRNKPYYADSWSELWALMHP